MTRKMTDAAREKEETACENFWVKEKPQEWLSQGLTIVVNFVTSSETSISSVDD